MVQSLTIAGLKYVCELTLTLLGVDIPGVDIPGVDIPGVDIPGVDIPGVDILRPTRKVQAKKRYLTSVL